MKSKTNPNTTNERGLRNGSVDTFFTSQPVVSSGRSARHNRLWRRVKNPMSQKVTKVFDRTGFYVNINRFLRDILGAQTVSGTGCVEREKHDSSQPVLSRMTFYEARTQIKDWRLSWEPVLRRTFWAPAWTGFDDGIIYEKTGFVQKLNSNVAYEYSRNVTTGYVDHVLGAKNFTAKPVVTINFSILIK